jgi:hypothetical protein
MAFGSQSLHGDTLVGAIIEYDPEGHNSQVSSYVYSSPETHDLDVILKYIGVLVTGNSLFQSYIP